MKDIAEDFFGFLRRCPTAHHVGSVLVETLATAGFEPFPPTPTDLAPGAGYYVRRGTGFLAALRIGSESLEETGARLTLAHSDSPALQLKVRGLSETGALRTAPVEVYGSPILTSWLDTPLEIAGTVALRGEEGIELHPIRTGKPVAVIPNLAIHLNRKVNEGQTVEKHTQLRPVFDEAFVEKGVLPKLCELAGLDPNRILDGELYLIPAGEPAAWGTPESGYYTASRIDNLAGVYGNIQGLLAAEHGEATQIAVVFDHEEIGSLSRTGARAPIIAEILSALSGSAGLLQSDLYRRSLLLSNDATHGNHPNFPEKHDPNYLPELGGGPALKLSAVRRYATEPEATAKLRLIAEEADVHLQEIQNRADLPAGTTVGAMTAASTMMPTVDLGVPILGMHSARESGNLRDLKSMIRLMHTFYRSKAPGK